ncbi:MAG: hypothetical protein JXJ22_15310 [Bacteroidales bacterium]|nr:hypothetical protein [Bacteroidales bacterium]
MTVCNNCGVELEKSMNFCPLCGDPVIKGNFRDKDAIKEEKIRKQQQALSDIEKLDQFQKRKLVWEVFSIILVSGIIVTLILNLILNHELTWSKFTIAGCIAVFSYVSIFSFWPKRIIFHFTGSFITTSAFLLFLELWLGKIDWTLSLGIPILFAFYFIALLTLFVIKMCKQKGFNLIAYIFIAVALLIISIEGIISNYLYNRIFLSWSLIVLVSILPLSAILLFIHFRLRRGTSLKKFFHI